MEVNSDRELSLHHVFLSTLHILIHLHEHSVRPVLYVVIIPITYKETEAQKGEVIYWWRQS